MNFPAIDPKILVSQITPYTCSLACLESVFRQHGYPTTQQSLLNDYPDLCFVGRVLNGQDISGALYPAEFETLCAHLNFQPYRFRFVPENINRLENPGDNQAIVFYSSRFDGNPAKRHYFRFLKMEPTDRFWFMNPTDTTLFRVIAQRLFEWQTEFFVLTLPPTLANLTSSNRSY